MTAAESKQNFENTVPHFSKQDKKDAEKNETNESKIHTDIGKQGRKPVMAYTDHFYNAGTAEDNDFFVEVDDNTKYYKFDPDKYKEYFAKQANTTDQEGFAKDYYLTLNETRNA